MVETPFDDEVNEPNLVGIALCKARGYHNWTFDSYDTLDMICFMATCDECGVEVESRELNVEWEEEC